MCPFNQTAPWSMESIRGCAKFLDRVWNLQTIFIDGNEYSAKFEKMIHRAIKKVSYDIEDMKFNTAISTLMTMVIEFFKVKVATKSVVVAWRIKIIGWVEHYLLLFSASAVTVVFKLLMSSQRVLTDAAISPRD